MRGVSTLNHALAAFVSLLSLSSASQVIERDVCVIGGGSSGTYAAIRLQQMGKSVALIERKGRLGGHVNTFTDPATKQTYDYGVQLFSNISVVQNYFGHFGIPLVPFDPIQPNVSDFVNFDTGALVPPTQLIGGNLTAALIGYAEQQDKFPEIFPKWDLPNPVPEELLMPFGDFVEKHNLQAITYTIFLTAQGARKLLDQPTLYVLKYMDQLDVEALEGISPFVQNGLQNNQELYNRALAELGCNAFLSSEVTQVRRHEDHVEVRVDTPEGTKVIEASKLVIAIPPTVSNLAFLDLDSQDRNLLSNFNNSFYWDMLIQNSGIPENTSVSNVNPEAPVGLPILPGLYGFSVTPLPDIHAAYYSSPHPMTNEQVKADTLATLARIRKGLNFPDPEQEPEFVGFHNHAPFVLTVSTDEIAAGFYRKLEALQGKSRTFWTGAAWLEQASSPLWNFTEFEILPGVVA